MPVGLRFISDSTPVRYLWPTDREERGPLASRAISCLQRGGITTAGELVAMSAKDVRDLRNAGPAVTEEVHRALAVHGLCLKGDEPGEAAEEETRVRVLRAAGLGPAAARRFARETWPCGELGPGIVLTVTGEAGRG